MIVSNTLSFSLSLLPPRLAPGSKLIHIRPLGSVGSAFLQPPGMQMQMQTQLQCKANLASLLPFAGYFDATRWPLVIRCAWAGFGCTAYFIPPLPPLSPGAPPRVWNVEDKTKVPDRYQAKQGGEPHPKTPSRRPDNPKVGSVPSRQPVAGAVLHTTSLHTCTPAHLRTCASASLCTSHVP